MANPPPDSPRSSTRDNQRLMRWAAVAITILAAAVLIVNLMAPRGVDQPTGRDNAAQGPARSAPLPDERARPDRLSNPGATSR